MLNPTALTATAVPKVTRLARWAWVLIHPVHLPLSHSLWVSGSSVTFFLALFLADKCSGCTWRMTEKTNGVKSSPANNHNHHAPPAIKANGKDDHRTSSR